MTETILAARAAAWLRRLADRLEAGELTCRSLDMTRPAERFPLPDREWATHVPTGRRTMTLDLTHPGEAAEYERTVREGVRPLQAPAP